MSNYYSLQLEKQNKVMDTLMKQLGNGFITVSFIGEYNSGKSTLINALLGNRYMFSWSLKTACGICAMQYTLQNSILLCLSFEKLDLSQGAFNVHLSNS